MTVTCPRCKSVRNTSLPRVSHTLGGEVEYTFYTCTNCTFSWETPKQWVTSDPIVGKLLRLAHLRTLVDPSLAQINELTSLETQIWAALTPRVWGVTSVVDFLQGAIKSHQSDVS